MMGVKLYSLNEKYRDIYVIVNDKNKQLGAVEMAEQLRGYTAPEEGLSSSQHPKASYNYQ